MREFFIVNLVLLSIQIEFSKAIILKYTNLTLSNKPAKPLYYELKNEEKLIDFLLHNYNPNVIPQLKGNRSLKLDVGLSMAQLINIYDKEQIMKTNVWIHMWWHDPSLKWDHIEEFKEIHSIRIPSNLIWVPDMILFNNAFGKYDISYKSKVVLYKHGGLLWIPPVIFKSSCHLDVKYFPFDTQVCEMIFGSWVYTSDELTFDYFESSRSVDLSDYIPSGSWDILNAPASISYYTDTNRNKTRAQMVYKIVLKRKSLFYSVNLIIPTFLISFLTVCVFYLPTGDGEKITLSLSLLFALVVFFLLIAKIIPPTNIVVPLISKYLLFTFLVNIFSIFNTCVVINIYYKSVKLDHPWIHYVFIQVLPKLLMMKNELIKKRKDKLEKQTQKPASLLESPIPDLKDLNAKLQLEKLTEKQIETKFKTFNGYKPIDFESNVTVWNKKKFRNSGKFRKIFYENEYFEKYQRPDKLSSIEEKSDRIEFINKKLNESSRSILYLTNMIKSKVQLEQNKKEWKFVASVLDRFMLILFICVTFLGVYFTIFQSP